MASQAKLFCTLKYSLSDRWIQQKNKETRNQRHDKDHTPLAPLGNYPGKFSTDINQHIYSLAPTLKNPVDYFLFPFFAPR